MNALDAIILKLKHELATDTVELYDFSQAHEGHATLAPSATNLHLKGRIASPCFSGLNRVARERLVQSILKDEIASGVIHALSFELSEN